MGKTRFTTLIYLKLFYRTARLQCRQSKKKIEQINKNGIQK